MMEGKTVIAIAHRLSTIARMDRIVVLDDGAIAEQGTHGFPLLKKPYSVEDLSRTLRRAVTRAASPGA